MSSANEGPVATIDDLHRVEGKAELIAGKIVRYPPNRWRLGLIIGQIFSGLHDHARATGRGGAYMSTLTYAVPKLPSGRESFSPDASYYVGRLPDNPMDFIPGPPTFAVEIRDEDVDGPSDESAMAAKRLDYFEAGTLVVWDVDPEAERVHSYRADSPDQPITFRKGQVADAEPAVPGWRMAVVEIFA